MVSGMTLQHWKTNCCLLSCPQLSSVASITHTSQVIIRNISTKTYIHAVTIRKKEAMNLKVKRGQMYVRRKWKGKYFN